ncbi:MAG: hypothetical protein A3J74_09045 [Elusimicrobia bacterium RIFCSPHIGHO2_02_FULL_57_9]|nr:MAG: hypothetical protein A3J74_09045 [Elusimicrobia bacterium RIFCSPHIGHO2_02_FULL_57_9]
MTRPAPALFLVFLGLIPRAQAETSTAPVISRVHVERLNVFDPRVPGENWWPFRVANKIHFPTQETVLKRELLLQPAQRWNQIDIMQSERNLRALGIFRKVELRSVPRQDGKLDLSLYAQDSWTTNVQFSLGTEGGDHFLTYGASEDNLFGYDKSISFLHSQIGPKIRNDLRYSDPRFLGSRFRLAPFYVHTHVGDSVGAHLYRPFFALESTHATGMEWNRSVDEDILYQNASERSKFLRRSRVVALSYGLRLDHDALLVQRVEGGWYSQSDQFYQTPATVGGLPEDRDMSGPTIAYSWVQPRYIKETYINKMERDEDFNLGNELKLFGGAMGSKIGSDRDRWIFNAVDQQGISLGPGRFALCQVGASGRMSAGKGENALLFANLNLFWKMPRLYPQTWVSHIEVNKGKNLDMENQVILGGDSGLRGYKNRSFSGDKSVLMNFENRFFFPGEYFHLLRFGGAAFFDSGWVAPERQGISWKDFKSDVGFGLRFSSTRSQTGDVVRFDLAYAVNDGPGRSRWVVSVRGRQAFQIFNSSTRSVRQSPSSRLQ